jgi:ketosteroid isomerase-like protein
MDTDTDTSTHTDRLPTVVRAFMAAHESRDADAALALLAPGATITDVGESFSGEAALRGFITGAGAEFTYTDEITGVAGDGDTWVVGHHLEGDFPGGTADLDYRFVLDGRRIARLDIVVG